MCESYELDLCGDGYHKFERRKVLGECVHLRATPDAEGLSLLRVIPHDLARLPDPVFPIHHRDVVANLVAFGALDMCAWMYG